MAEQRFIIIQQGRDDDAQVAVLPRDFERGRDDQFKGWKALRYEDGTDYQSPEPAKAADAPAGKKP